MDYNPDEIIIEDWGRLQVVIDGVDRTEWNGAPVIVNGWSSREPFGYVSCQISFPTITPFEMESVRFDGDLFGDMPFCKYDNVEINLIDADGEYVKVLFEGMIISFSDELSDNSVTFTVECIGAMYQADLMKKAPRFSDGALDIATAIAFEMNTRIDSYGLRLTPLSIYAWTNIPSRSRGSWSNLLTGWVQELLSIAYASNFFDGEEFAMKVTTIEQDDWSGLQAVGTLGTQLSLTSPSSKRNWEKVPFYGSITYIIKFARGLAMLGGYNGLTETVSDMAQRPQGDGFWYVNRGGRVFEVGDAPQLGHSYLWDLVDLTQAIDCTPTGLGYWTLTGAGIVHDYGDAVHYGNGSSLSSILGVTDVWVDLQPTASGNGYWLISHLGRVEEHGDAAAFADAPWPPPTGGGHNEANAGLFYVDTAMTDDHTGMWLAAQNGYVHSLGTATDFAGVDIGEYQPIVSIASNSFDEYVLMRIDGTLFPTEGHWSGPDNWYQTQTFARRQDVSMDAWPDVYQFTLALEPGRRPVIKIKDEWTKNWNVTVGQPGVTHSLSRDWTMSPNVYYGEGIDPENCRWRNTKYPNLKPDDSAVWPGYYISVSLNNTEPGVLQWERAMKSRGYSLEPDGVYSAVDANECRKLQGNCGIIIDGVVGPQTWNRTFGVGSNQGSVEGAYFAPLAISLQAEPFTYNGQGMITGNNIFFDPRGTPRIEVYDNYGENVSKADAAMSATARLKRESEVGYYGTITLKTDPNEGSRFDIEPGQNIVYNGYRLLGDFDYVDSVKFHIAEVKYDMQNLTVTLTVDSQSRDAATIIQMMTRNKEAFEPGPSRIRTRHASQGKATEDRISVWDCESGAGIIPRQGIAGGIWNITKIPMGEYGQVVQTYIKTDVPAQLAVGIFDTGAREDDLQALPHGYPNAGNPSLIENYWKLFNEATGLVIAWGEVDQMGGYWPGRGSEGEALTGVLMDKASWNFWTTDPPWLWVAIWSSVTTFVQGRLYPGQEAPGVRPDVAALADPVLRELPSPTEYFLS